MGFILWWWLTVCYGLYGPFSWMINDFLKWCLSIAMWNYFRVYRQIGETSPTNRNLLEIENRQKIRMKPWKIKKIRFDHIYVQKKLSAGQKIWNRSNPRQVLVSPNPPTQFLIAVFDEKSDFESTKSSLVRLSFMQARDLLPVKHPMCVKHQDSIYWLGLKQKPTLRLVESW